VMRVAPVGTAVIRVVPASTVKDVAVLAITNPLTSR
jgi:hypothetical protein